VSTHFLWLVTLDEPRSRPSLWNAAEVTKLTFITAIEPSGVGG